MGIPKAIASDDGWEYEGRSKQILDAEGIDHIVMTTHWQLFTASQGQLNICYLKEYNILGNNGIYCYQM